MSKSEVEDGAVNLPQHVMVHGCAAEFAANYFAFNRWKSAHYWKNKIHTSVDLFLYKFGSF